MSATEFVVADILAPALPRPWERDPTLTVTLQSEAAVVSLAARDADIAVRMSRPEGASHVARRLPELALGLFASPGYLDGRSPRAIDFARGRLLVYDDSYGRLPELDWITAAGLDSTVALRTGSARALLMTAMAGGGLAVLPRGGAQQRAGRCSGTFAPARPIALDHNPPRSAPSALGARGTVLDC